jgi:hypothetical protein
MPRTSDDVKKRPRRRCPREAAALVWQQQRRRSVSHWHRVRRGAVRASLAPARSGRTSFRSGRRRCRTPLPFVVCRDHARGSHLSSCASGSRRRRVGSRPHRSLAPSAAENFGLLAANHATARSAAPVARECHPRPRRTIRNRGAVRREGTSRAGARLWCRASGGTPLRERSEALRESPPPGPDRA